MKRLLQYIPKFLLICIMLMLINNACEGYVKMYKQTKVKVSTMSDSEEDGDDDTDNNEYAKEKIKEIKIVESYDLPALVYTTSHIITILYHDFYGITDHVADLNTPPPNRA